MAEISTAQAADLLWVCPRTLERYRDRGIGPPYYRQPGGRVLYDEAQVLAYREHVMRVAPRATVSPEGSTSPPSAAADAPSARRAAPRPPR
jgi:hypothetical protein